MHQSSPERKCMRTPSVCGFFLTWVGCYEKHCFGINAHTFLFQDGHPTREKTKPVPSDQSTQLPVMNRHVHGVVSYGCLFFRSQTTRPRPAFRRARFLNWKIWAGPGNMQGHANASTGGYKRLPLWRSNKIKVSSVRALWRLRLSSWQ